MSPSVPSTFFPIKLATWNSASLLGGLYTLPERWRRKRLFLKNWLDVVMLFACRRLVARSLTYTFFRFHIATTTRS